MKKIEVKLRITAMTWLKIERKLNFLAVFLGFGTESSFVAVGLGFVATVGADLSGVVFGSLEFSGLALEGVTRLTRIVVVLELVSDFFVLFFDDFGAEDFLALGLEVVLEVLTLIISGVAELGSAAFSSSTLVGLAFVAFFGLVLGVELFWAFLATSALVKDLLGRRDSIIRL